MVFKNDFQILLCLLQRKIVVNIKYFSFDRKFFFNFQKIVYSFKNRKLFFNFVHFFLKSMDSAKTCLWLHRDLIGTRPRHLLLNIWRPDSTSDEDLGFSCSLSLSGRNCSRSSRVFLFSYLCLNDASDEALGFSCTTISSGCLADKGSDEASKRQFHLTFAISHIAHLNIQMKHKYFVHTVIPR